MNKAPENGMPPLMAVFLDKYGINEFTENHKRCVELLLAAGADVNVEC